MSHQKPGSGSLAIGFTAAHLSTSLALPARLIDPDRPQKAVWTHLQSSTHRLARSIRSKLSNTCLPCAKSYRQGNTIPNDAFTRLLTFPTRWWHVLLGRHAGRSVLCFFNLIASRSRHILQMFCSVFQTTCMFPYTVYKPAGGYLPFAMTYLVSPALRGGGGGGHRLTCCTGIGAPQSNFENPWPRDTGTFCIPGHGTPGHHSVTRIPGHWDIL